MTHPGGRGQPRRAAGDPQLAPFPLAPSRILAPLPRSLYPPPDVWAHGNWRRDKRLTPQLQFLSYAGRHWKDTRHPAQPQAGGLGAGGHLRSGFQLRSCGSPSEAECLLRSGSHVTLVPLDPRPCCGERACGCPR